MANVWKEGGISNKYVQNFFLVNLKINKKSNILKIITYNQTKGEKISMEYSNFGFQYICLFRQNNKNPLTE